MEENARRSLIAFQISFVTLLFVAWVVNYAALLIPSHKENLFGYLKYKI